MCRFVCVKPIRTGIFDVPAMRDLFIQLRIGPSRFSCKTWLLGEGSAAVRTDKVATMAIEKCILSEDYSRLDRVRRRMMSEGIQMKTTSRGRRSAFIFTTSRSIPRKLRSDNKEYSSTSKTCILITLIQDRSTAVVCIANLATAHPRWHFSYQPCRSPHWHSGESVTRHRWSQSRPMMRQREGGVTLERRYGWDDQLKSRRSVSCCGR